MTRLKLMVSRLTSMECGDRPRNLLSEVKQLQCIGKVNLWVELTHEDRFTGKYLIQSETLKFFGLRNSGIVVASFK